MIKSKLFTSVLLSLSAFGSIYSFAAENKVSVVELLGSKYYVYEVKKGDTLFGIAREQNWNDSTLQVLNPSAIAPLKKGMKIYYPYLEASKCDDTAVAPTSALSDSTVVQQNIRKVTHIVKRGETLPGISITYSIPLEKLSALNPTAIDGIKAGDIIILSIDSPSDTTDTVRKARYVTIKADDTLGDIARRENVSVASILKENPGLSIKEFREGVNLRLPQKGTGIKYETQSVASDALDDFILYVVDDANDSWQSIAAKYEISEQVLKNANPQISQLKKNLYIAIPRMKSVTSTKEVEKRDSRESSENGLISIYGDVHHITSTDAPSAVRVAIVPETNNSKKDIEYIRGFLTGIDMLKNDYKINLKVMNATLSKEEMINQLDAFKPNMVFSISEKTLPDYLCEYAEISETPIVNSFDVKSYSFANNPYVVQLLTPPNLFNDNIAAYIEDKFADYTVLFLGDCDSTDMLANSLKATLGPGKYRELSAEEFDVARVNPEGKYIFYTYETKQDALGPFLDKVTEIRESLPYADLYTMGRPNLIMHTSALGEKMHSANTLIPSRFYIDTESEQYKAFLSKFNSLFHKTPVKSMPLYAGVGYDNATYFVKQLAENHGDVNNFTPSLSNLQSYYDLTRMTPWSGFMNPPVFMLRFTPFNTVEQVVVNYR